ILEIDVTRRRAVTLAAAGLEVRGDGAFVLPSEELEVLLRDADGGARNGLGDGLDQLASELALERFLWFRIALPGKCYALVAGYNREAAAFRLPFDAAELSYFRMMGQHLASVIENLSLMAQLKDERRQLQVRVEERTVELSQ